MGNEVTFKYTDPKATEASQGYPDAAKLDVTLDQLKSAPDFKYVPDPQIETENTGPGASSPATRATP